MGLCPVQQFKRPPEQPGAITDCSSEFLVASADKYAGSGFLIYKGFNRWVCGRQETCLWKVG